MQTYTIVYQQEPDGWYTVWVKELPWCVTYGETFEEARSMIQDAAEGYLYAMHDKEQKKLPKSSLIVYANPMMTTSNIFTSHLLVAHEAV